MEEGYVLGNIEACLTRNLCECIFYFYGEICGILEIVPIFLMNAFHIPESLNTSIVKSLFSQLIFSMYSLCFLYVFFMFSLCLQCHIRKTQTEV